MSEHGGSPGQGTLIDGRYRIIERLAVGGMSTVYRATDIRLERSVALKLLHPHLAEDPAFVERFRTEAITAAGFSHPHIVGVLDTGVDGTTAYLAMELIRGHTLRQLLKDQGRLAPRQTLALLDAIVEGLSAAHTVGLVHRDIKPENVLLSDSGQIKVADFGLARAATNQTSTGNLIGTVAYVSPELVTGAPADARSDIYALGIMAYEMLTGQQPFVADTPIAVAYKHVTSDVPAPSLVLPGLATDLDELVEFCTRREPEDRPQDAEALLGEIRQIRRTLTDEQLDHPAVEPRETGGPAFAPHPPTSVGESAAGSDETEVIDRGGQQGNATEVIGGGSNETSVIAAAGATRALPRLQDGTDTGQLSAVVPVSETTPTGDDRPLSPRARERQARKDDKSARKQWAREAQKPRESLESPSSRRRGWILGIVLFLVAVVVATGAWFFGMGPGSPVQIPQFSGQPTATAVQSLAADGVASTQRQVFDEQIKQGRVVGSEPEAGATIRRYQSVELLISKGPELFAVPNVVGRDAKAVDKTLKSAHVTAGKVSREYNESIAAGLVVSQDPAPDRQVRRGTKVAYVVSRGPAPVKVPDVTGRSEKDAVATLEAAGLTAKKAGEEFDAKIAKGSVISQDPASGTAKRDSTVTYTVSKGPKMVEVPGVRGKQLDEATRILEEAGFVVKVNESSFGIIFNTVATQDPKAGSKQPEGSTITIGVV
ncbi:protein kinase domain-containing protein [Arthrobacter sp.]|uniref:protein kinase domain-containing protein n=1 Tax=Arthrobacter sp. TaxID=1667 RepID=UPI003A9387AF